MRGEAEAASADTEDRIVVTNTEDPLPEPEMPFYEEGENGSQKKNGTSATNWPAAICMGAKGSRRTLRKPCVCFRWKQIRGMSFHV